MKRALFLDRARFTTVPQGRARLVARERILGRGARHGVFAMGLVGGVTFTPIGGHAGPLPGTDSMMLHRRRGLLALNSTHCSE